MQKENLGTLGNLKLLLSMTSRIKKPSCFRHYIFLFDVYLDPHCSAFYMFTRIRTSQGQKTFIKLSIQSPGARQSERFSEEG